MCANLSVLGQFGRLLIFIFPCAFLPCRITSNLHVSLEAAILLVLSVVFNFQNFSQLRKMHARTWFKISSRSVVPKKCTARIFTLTSSAHLLEVPPLHAPHSTIHSPQPTTKNQTNKKEYDFLKRTAARFPASSARRTRKSKKGPS